MKKSRGRLKNNPMTGCLFHCSKDQILVKRIQLHICTLYNVCAVPWGDIMSTVGSVQYRGGYLEYHGGCSVLWG